MIKRWTDDEIKFMSDFYADLSTEEVAKKLDRPITQIYNMAKRMELKKSEAVKRLNYSKQKANSGCFKKGMATWNKGIKGSTGLHENSKKHHFAGNPHNTRSIGSKRVTRDGYLEVKTGQRKWELCHVLLWQEHFGEIKKGCSICFKNGDKTNITIDNLELLTRAELMERNTIHRLPADLKEVVRLHCKIKRRLMKNAKD